MSPYRDVRAFFVSNSAVFACDDLGSISNLTNFVQSLLKFECYVCYSSFLLNNLEISTFIWRLIEEDQKYEVYGFQRASLR